MKKSFTILLSVVFLSLWSFAQEVGTTYTPEVSQNAYFDVSLPLTEIGPIPPRGASGHHQYKNHPGIPKLQEETVYKNIENALPKGDDPAWQMDFGGRGISPPIQNFQGVRNDDNGGYYDLIAPPDTDGDVGPNHYFQMCNTIFEIFDKSGNTLFGPADNSTIWNGFIGDWTGTNDGDPIVLYDEQADRWMVSQFAVDTDITGGTYWILVAISTSSNPTGSYYRYAFEYTNFPDYPKFGIWRDGYYLMVQHGNGTATASVLNRSQMLAGNSTAQRVTFAIPNLPGSGFSSVLPADNDGQWAPTGTPNYFVYFSDDAWGDDPVDRLKVWEFDVNWTWTFLSTLTLTQNLNTTAFSSAFGTHNQGIIPQPGTTRKLAVMEKALMNRLQYRNFGSYQSMVCCHTVDVNDANRAGIRWYELRRTTGDWYIYQQGTYAPGSTDNYWMASIAQNASGDIALGYSVSSSSTYPSIRYTGRKLGDALGQMTMGEGVIMNGADSQEGTSRWGDYTMLSVDPSDDETFWYTNEYNDDYTTWGNWITQVASFQIDDYCTASGGCAEYIQRVQFGNIDNSSACEGYSNYTDMSNSIPLNGAEDLTVTIGNPYSGDDVTVWVDWNRDGDFDDAYEEIGYLIGNGPHTFSIDPPASATIGECTMRIRLAYYGDPPSSPCGSTTFGEVEDYTVNITAGATSNYWIGVTSTDWHTGSNWSLGTVPTSTTSVTIPAGTPYQPVIGSEAYAASLYLNTGATLTHNNGVFHVYGTFDAGFGQFTMTSTNAYLYLQGNNNSYWWDDNQNDTFTTVVIYKDNVDNTVTMPYDATISHIFQVYVGTFTLSTSVITGTSTASDAFRVNNNGKIILDSSLDGLITAGSITFYSGSQALITDGFINCAKDFIVNSNTLYNIAFTGGTLNMNGSSTQYINDLDGGTLDLFNLNVNKSAGTCYIKSANLDVNGDVTISGGALSCNNAPSPTMAYNISVAGDWSNSVGEAGFEESTGRVIFDGPGHQYVLGDEHFNILEVNNGAALRVNNTSFDVTCNSYDWTAGGIDVISGTFTALDLADNGLFGGFWVNPTGVINLTNDGWVDLNGEIHNFGGILNVSGSISDWPYSANALVEMTSGVIDFKTCGITMIDNANSLTTNISGGTIRTAYNFSNERNDVDLSDLTVEMYGTTAASISLDPSSPISNLNVSKVAAKGDSHIIENEFIQLRDGTKVPVPKDIAVTVFSDLLISNDLNIESGTLQLNGFAATIDGDCNINGLMDVGATGSVLNHGLFELGETGTLSIGGGSFVNDHPYGTKAWQNLDGTFNLSDGLFEIMHNSILLGSTFVDNITGGTMRTGMSFRALTPGTFEPSGGNFEFTGAGITGPYIDCPSGNYFNDFDINSTYDYVLYANTEVRGDVTINGGLLDFYGFDLSCLGNVTVNSGGTISVPENSTLKLDDGSDLNVYIGGEIQLIGSSGNEAMVTHVSTGTYQFWIYGTIGAEYAIFEFMDGNGINVRPGGNVDALYTFNNCSFRKGAPSPSALLTLHQDQTFTCNNAYFENTFGNTLYNVWKYEDNGHFTFVDATGFFAGPAYEYDPYDHVDWTGFTSGLWTGLVSSDWFTPENWDDYIVPDVGVDVTIPAGTPNNPLITGANAFCNNIDINAGASLEIGDGQLNAANNVNIWGELIMTNSLGVLYITNRIYWQAGSTDDVTAGEIRTTYWTWEDGTNAQLGTGNTAYINSSLGTYDPDASLGNLVVTGDLDDGGIDGKELYPVRISGNCLITNGKSWQTPVDWIINGTFEIEDGASFNIHSGAQVTCDQSFTLDGTLILSPTGGTLIHDVFTFGATGELNITDASFICDHSQSSGWMELNGDVTMTSGLLEFTATNVKFQGTSTISDGTVRVGRSLLAAFAGAYQPSGGVTELIGASGSHYLSIYNGNFVHDLNVSRTAQIYTANDLVVQNNLTVNSQFNSGTYHTITVDGDVEINNGGFLNIQDGASLELSGSSILNVQNGGILNVIGTEGNEAMVTHSSGYYEFNVNLGGTIGAEHAIFEYMKLYRGVNVDAGGIVDPVYSFNHCTFRNGDNSVSSALLVINNDQNLTITGASFPNATMQYNVGKENNAGHLTFVDFSGAFSGEDYDYDPFNLIDWYIPTLEALPLVRNVGAPAGSTTFEILSNLDWTATESTAWFTISPGSGTGNGVLTVNYQANTTFIPRTGQILLTADGVDDVILTVNQAAMEPTLSVTPAIRNVTAPAGQTTFSLTSNTSWTVSESVSWFSVSPMSGTNNKTLVVTYQENTSLTSRTGQITISASGVPDVVVTVSQAGATPVLSVTPASRSVTAPAGSTTFGVESNTSWSVGESVAWFTVAPMSGSGNNTLTVNYQQNTSVTPRSGQITVSASGVPDVVVTVNQAGAGAILTVSPSNRDVTPPAGNTTFSVSSNTSWAVSESITWLNVTPMSGSGNGTLTVNYGENATGSTRVGPITVIATGGSPSQTVTVTQESYPTHVISVPEGWSGLSSYIMPANNDITDVFSPVSGSFVIATTMTGIYYPTGPINTIIDWESQSAYKLKMSAAATLPIIGNEETNKTFGMAEGWNLMPVISNSPVDAAGLFSGVSFEIVKDVAGVGLMWPEYGINTLGVFVPGRVYVVKMNSVGAVTFPPNVKNAIAFEIPQTEFPSHPWNEIHNGPSTHSIAIMANGISGAMPGDVIGVFDESGKCFGIAEIANIDNNTAITAFADDPYTYEKDGFGANDPMDIKLFRPATSEVFPTDVTWDDRMPNSSFFEDDGISVISGFKVSSVGMNEALASSIQMHPNPSNGLVEISGIEKFNHIEIFNAGGELIRTFNNNYENVMKINLTDLPAGIYQLKFTGTDNSVIKKLIRN